MLKTLLSYSEAVVLTPAAGGRGTLLVVSPSDELLTVTQKVKAIMSLLFSLRSRRWIPFTNPCGLYRAPWARSKGAPTLTCTLA